VYEKGETMSATKVPELHTGLAGETAANKPGSNGAAQAEMSVAVAAGEYAINATASELKTINHRRWWKWKSLKHAINLLEQERLCDAFSSGVPFSLSDFDLG
jgi:hypothetical protein